VDARLVWIYAGGKSTLGFVEAQLNYISYTWLLLEL
jgi:hypothetical protein